VAVLVTIAVVVIVGWVALGGPFRRVARVLWPAQLTGITTRSSLATIPVLMTGFEKEIPEAVHVAGYVVPLAGALLKLSRAVSGTTKFLFLVTLLGIPVTFERVLIFTATIILLSPSTVGVPRVTSGSRSLPAYVAAGVPPEYVVLLGATTAITDIFLTMINTTGYFTAASLANAADRRQPTVDRGLPGPASAL
jgi:Na+/H+-dicarboxylate symporter